jgi:hypothetical protein
MPDLGSLTNEAAAAWLIAEAPINTTGFGRLFAAKVAELLDAKVATTRADVIAEARAIVTDLTTNLINVTRHNALNDAATLIDDAVALGEDPKAAVVRERDRAGGSP